MSNTINIKEVQPLHLFSESTHYVCSDTKGKKITFKNLSTGELVELSPEYVQKFLKAADQYTSIVKVGKEDKLWTAKQIAEAVAKKEIKEGEVAVGEVRVKGIRTIWEEIHSNQVWTAAYYKQDKFNSAASVKKAREKQIADALEAIEKAKVAKKGVAEAAKKAIESIQANPVQEVERGELRVLRGYKLQFTSRDGKYNCVDVDAPSNDSARGIRPVNINTLMWLVFDGVKYEVE